MKENDIFKKTGRLMPCCEAAGEHRALTYHLFPFKKFLQRCGAVIASNTWFFSTTKNKKESP